VIVSDDGHDHDEGDNRDDHDDRGERGLLALAGGDKKPSWLSTYGSPLWRIALLLALLAALIILRKPCADGVAGFVGNFGQPVASPATRDGGMSRHMTQRSAPASGPASAPAAVKSTLTAPRGDAAPRH
jgi:hypothetical protein